MPPHLLELARESQVGSFWRVRGAQGFECPGRGCRPGTISAADVFDVLSARIQGRIDMQAAQGNLAWTPPPSVAHVGSEDDQEQSHSSTSFVDDLAALMAAPASELAFKTMRLTDIILIQCTKHGFRLNFDKTAVMLSFRGAGARTQARQYYTKQQNYLVSDLHDFKVPIAR
eukprot:8256594-Pyramimonas_sp.AAC.1